MKSLLFFLFLVFFFKFSDLLFKFGFSVLFIPVLFLDNLSNHLVKLVSAYWWGDSNQTELLDDNYIETENVFVLNILLFLPFVFFTSANNCVLILLAFLLTTAIEEFTISKFSCNFFFICLS